jgi:hypothetical protein
VSLNIEFIGEYEPGVGHGLISVNDFVEDFESDLTFWTAYRYEAQWREGIDRLLRGESRSCLITSIWGRPAEGPFGVWWTLYRQGHLVVVRNQLLFSSVFPEFNPEEPYGSIPERTLVNEEGNEISEWSLEVNSISPLLPSDRCTDL